MTATRLSICLFALLVSAFAPPRPALAQEGFDPEAELDEGPRVTARRTDEAPVIDGVLDERAWRDATVVEDFRVTEPIAGVPLRQPTVVRILYDEEAIYFGFTCFDDPAAVVRTALRRDADLRSDDRIMVMLDTFYERRTGYAFQVNPNGARWDALIEDGGSVNSQWDAIWDAESRMTDSGWVVEIAIPMKSLNFPEEGRGVWGLNLFRGVARQNQTGRWAFPLQNVFLFDVARFGHLDGLRGLEQGIGLDAIPAYTLRQTRDNAGSNVSNQGIASLDVFYKITPELTNVLTTNTDFTEAQPDRRLANLTRFSLFFPEQRDFFLQDAGIFRFADFGRFRPFAPQKVNGQPFFSRRIGLSDDGPLAIRFGEKLTGRIGPLNVGFLSSRIEGYTAGSVADDTFVDAEGKWLTVGRATLNVLEESSVGLIMTYGDPAENKHNKLFGADFNYRTVRFLGDKILQGSAWGQQTSSSGLKDKEGAFGASLQYPNDKWNWEGHATEIQENFNPALGFANRRAIRDYEGRIRRRWRMAGLLRTIDIQLGGRLVTATDNDFQSMKLAFYPVMIQTDIGDRFRIGLDYVREDLLEDFEIRLGIIIPKDHYRWDRYKIELHTSRNRPLEGGVELVYGQFYTGTRFDTILDAKWRASEHVFLGIEYEQFQVRLPEGDFTTRVVRANFDFAFNADVSWTNLVQWDNESEELGWSSRFTWIVEPGNELVLAVDSFFERDDELRFDATETQLAGKVRWTFRY